ncbi:cupin domain-containing protein [Bradyrhizobium liaoningense]|uniref:cupin domain-containing protein n=1 Tax=Bradyrhizobium liaoningense TaxID=43992 RepID=UPI00289F1698|nr:cupin domain-containing protein [Bradyrhizobium liaoningense]
MKRQPGLIATHLRRATGETREVRHGPVSDVAITREFGRFERSRCDFLEGMMLIKHLLCIAVFAVPMTGSAIAQQTSPVPTAPTATTKRTPLQKFDVPGTNFETVIGMAEIVPNVNIGRHTHPGPESGFMLDGEIVLMVEGQPDKVVKTGESYQIASGAIHDAKSGPSGAKVIATYVVEKGKPLASPAP